MLMCEDMTRDVLCNELIDLTKCIKASECALSQDMMSHVRNMTAIFMSCDDFHYVPMTVQQARERLDGQWFSLPTDNTR